MKNSATRNSIVLLLLTFLGVNSTTIAANSFTDSLSNLVANPEKMARKCQKGKVDNCWPAGNAYLNGSNVAVNWGLANTLFTIGCKAGIRTNCKSLYTLGVSYRDGDGVTKDSQKALDIFRVACTGADSGRNNSAAACGAVGRLLMSGKGVAKDQGAAVRYFERGCEWGSYYSCRRYGDILYAGELVEKNIEGAVAAFTKACGNGEHNSQACLSVGLMHGQNELADSDITIAAKYFEFACDARTSIGRGCFELAQLQLKGFAGETNPANTIRLYQLACGLADKPWGPACVAAAEMYKGGHGVAANPDKVRDYYDSGCRRKDQESCRLSCELACQNGLQYACKAMQSGSPPIGVIGCLSDERDMIPDDMKNLMEQYWKDNPEQAAEFQKQVEKAIEDAR